MLIAGPEAVRTFYVSVNTLASLSLADGNLYLFSLVGAPDSATKKTAKSRRQMLLCELKKKSCAVLFAFIGFVGAEKEWS